MNATIITGCGVQQRGKEWIVVAIVYGYVRYLMDGKDWPVLCQDIGGAQLYPTEHDAHIAADRMIRQEHLIKQK